MTENDAIKIFKKLLCVPKDMIVKYDSVTNKEQKEELEKVYQAQQLAIYALEKQISQKPIYHDNCGNKTVSARCPRCHEVFDESGLQKYCGFCGQKVKVV